MRDLASGSPLLWRKVSAPSAEALIAMLRSLIDRLGAPLVFKSGRGGAFMSGELRDFLRSRGIEHLLSPPRYPPYNGACESGLRWLKEHTRWWAERRGEPDVWRDDDLARARARLNTLPRPHAPERLSACQAWDRRRPITLQERAV